MIVYNAKRTGKKVIFCAGVMAAAVAAFGSAGCGKKETPAPPPAATVAPAAAAPANPAGTSGLGVSPSNTIPQKEQADMSAEKTVK